MIHKKSKQIYKGKCYGKCYNKSKSSWFGKILFTESYCPNIYLTPSLSHLVSSPIYYFEPMRVFLIFTMVHMKKKNAYVLALTLPLFSFVVSAHPSFIKMLLITVELSLNVFFFYLISEKNKNLSLLYCLVFL